MLSWLKALLSKEAKDKALSTDVQPVLLSPKEMTKGLQGVFREQLEPLSFKAKGTTFIRQRCPEAYDQVHIGFRTYNEYEKNAPFFGADITVAIDSQPVARLYAQLAGEPYHQERLLTFALNIGYVMPRKSFLDWKFRRNQFPEKVAREMMEDTLKYGLPYLEQFDNWEAIYAETARLEARPRIRGPIIKYLMGKPEEAVAILEAELARIHTQTDPGMEHYRNRANALIDLCKHNA